MRNNGDFLRHGAQADLRRIYITPIIWLVELAGDWALRGRIK